MSPGPARIFAIFVLSLLNGYFAMYVFLSKGANPPRVWEGELLMGVRIQ